jgi:hypothetical protein
MSDLPRVFSISDSSLQARAADVTVPSRSVVQERARLAQVPLT